MNHLRPIFRRITADEIVDRAARRENRFWRVWNFVWWCFPVAIVILVGITEPVHTWLHAHLQFLWGVLAGTLVQSVGWLRDRWRWLMRDRPTHEEFPGGDSCGDDAVRWPK